MKRQEILRGLIQAAVWVLVLTALPLGALYVTARPVLAVGCPQCFGMAKAADGVYLQSGMDEAQRARALTAIDAGRSRAAQFYGELQHDPRILVCSDAACYQRIGGAAGSGIGSLGSIALEVSPFGVDPVFISAGLSRVELQGRVGFWKFSMGAVPMWFSEGVAVEVADDPNYVMPRAIGSRCKQGPFPDMPATPTEWQQELQTEGDVLYAQSACKVDMWIYQNGGPKAVTGLLDKVAQGQDFDKLFPPR